MKAKKLMTLCLVGILAVTTMSSTVFASSTISSQTVSADQETTVKYVPNGGGPSGPIDPDNPDTDPNNWMVYYEKTVDLTQGNINTEGTFATDGTKGKAFSFTVKRQVAGTITSTNSDGMNVSEGNVGTYGIQVTAVATDTSNPWNTDSAYIEMATNSVGIDDTIVPQMQLRKSTTQGGALLTGKTDILAKMTATTPTDTPSAAITGGMGDSNTIVNDGTSFSVNLTYTFAKASS